MKKIICKAEYDTEKSELLSKKCYGAYGDPAGYEECLFKTAEGKLFLYGFGGEQSPYPQEIIKRMSAEKARVWTEQ